MNPMVYIVGFLALTTIVAAVCMAECAKELRKLYEEECSEEEDEWE